MHTLNFWVVQSHVACQITPKCERGVVHPEGCDYLVGRLGSGAFDEAKGAVSANLANPDVSIVVTNSSRV
jgi:hypothetical protein